MQTIKINNHSLLISDILSVNFQIEGYGANGSNALRFIKLWFDDNPNIATTTSGTTGKPKIINVAKSLMRKSAKMTAEAIGLKSGDSALVCLNVDYIGGMMMLVRGLVLQLNLTIVEPSSDPFDQGQSIGTFDFIAVVPLQLQQIMDNDRSLKLFNQSRVVLIGGAPVSSRILQDIHQFVPELYNTYGMTETISHIALKRLNGEKASDSYSALPGVSIGQDERGCLTIKALVTNNQTIITNDCVNLLSESTFQWLGRIDNVVNSGGIKIHLEQLELQVSQLLKEFEINEDFFLLPVSDNYYGQTIALYLEGDAKREVELLEFLKSELGYKAPKSIHWKPKFHRTATGKINRKKSL